MHFSDKHPKHLFNFKALRCGNYSRLALKKEKRLVQSSESYSHEIPKKRSFQITANNYHTICTLVYSRTNNHFDFSFVCVLVENVF